jgi:phosphoribosylaminoimidazolecarboxamide formyltransferase/IMP cyclohydrolase
VVASKHANPCGVGSADTIYDAWMKAYNADPVSVLGGVIVCNRKVDYKTAVEMNKTKLDIIIAPSYTDDALKRLMKPPRGKNLRILTLKDMKRRQPADALDLKKVSGGILAQTVDDRMLSDNDGDLRVVTRRAPTESEMADLMFAWKIVKHAKSNGIAVGKNGQSVGVGPGQVNRIWATKQAIEHGHDALGADSTVGAALASDAYFPFDDCVEAAAAAGITAIIQPGGSINDQMSIDACDKHGIAMVFTGMRHFKH